MYASLIGNCLCSGQLCFEGQATHLPLWPPRPHKPTMRRWRALPVRALQQGPMSTAVLTIVVYRRQIKKIRRWSTIPIAVSTCTVYARSVEMWAQPAYTRQSSGLLYCGPGTASMTLATRARSGLIDQSITIVSHRVQAATTAASSSVGCLADALADLRTQHALDTACTRVAH